MANEPDLGHSSNSLNERIALLESRIDDLEDGLKALPVELQPAIQQATREVENFVKETSELIDGFRQFTETLEARLSEQDESIKDLYENIKDLFESINGFLDITKSHGELIKEVIDKLNVSPKESGSFKKSAGEVKWKISANWRKLRKGLRKDEVEIILGKPLKIEVYLGNETWHYNYPSDGEVEFENGVLENWNEPDPEEMD